MHSKNLSAYLLLGISALTVVAIIASNHPSTPNKTLSQPKPITASNPLEQKFQLLSTQGNSSCSQQFTSSISNMSDGQHIQGSCCSKMIFSRYKEQVQGLRKYQDIPQIPSDPYDIPASLAKELLNYDNTLTLTQDEQKVLDDALPKTNEKGYCCCRCWRWYVYEGLSKYLVKSYHFTSNQIVDLLNNSDGCGGES
ncbi:hypothetical protein HY025_00910 [Candidatus Daviesbacteria bacterium]|nr:hypothetical protein [Candidatus Daviesbacteria bacterium]